MALTTVLIVDDVASVRSQVLEEFEAQGVKVLQASGQTELEKYLESPLIFR
ncbi:MAG: hypothetical protein HC875_30115 [Anaerolineales bacterium]|nr:hypothetical protein [Anaerolineales bacterium]